jgi:hypothetical protein
MAAVTYGVAHVPTTEAVPQSGRRSADDRKGWFASFMNALMESRQKQARREITKYAYLMDGSDRNGKTSEDLPFGGW